MVEALRRRATRIRLRDRQLYVLAVYDDAGDRRRREAAHRHRAVVSRSHAIKGNVLRWLGSGEVCTDHLSLICRPEDAERVAAAIAEALTVTCDDWDSLDLNAVDADDVPIAALLAALEERECLVSRQAADHAGSSTCRPPGTTIWPSISKSHRKQLRQLERRVLESDRDSLASASNLESDLDTAWDVLVDLHQRRRRSLGEPGCFASRPFHDFHREVVGRLLDRGQLRMSWLELDGTPAAAEYHLAGPTRPTPTRAASIPIASTKSRAGCRRFSASGAIDEGHRQFDFLRGDEPYKAHWRATPRATFDCRVVPNRRLARLRGRVLNLSGTVTDWVKHVGRQC